MQPDWNIIIAGLSLALAVIGGFVKLRVDITQKFGGVYSRLDKIETRLEIEEKTRDERLALTEIRMRDVMHKYCMNECPHRRSNTNPGIRIDGV